MSRSSATARRRRRPGSTSSPTRPSASRSSAEGAGYTWSRQQPREPDHAVVERSGRQPVRRGHLHPRRGDAASSGAPTAAAGPRPRERLRRPARPRLQPLRAHRRRDRSSTSSQFVARDDPVKILRLTLRNLSGRRGALSRDGLCRVGARRRRAQRERRTSCTELDADDRRAARPQRLEPRLRRPRRLSRPRRPSRHPGPAIAREFIGRHGSPAAPAALARRAPLPAASAPGSIRAARCRRRDRLAPGERARSSFSSGQAASAAEAEALVAQLPRRRSRRRRSTPSRELLGRSPRRGPGETPDRVDRPHAQRLAALPDARLPHVGAVGLLPGERRLRLPRPAPGFAWRCAAARPRSRASTSSRAAARQFEEGDVQHWWLPTTGPGRPHPHLRRSGAGSPMSSPTTSRTTGDTAVLDETGAVPRRPAPRPGEHDAFFQPADRATSAHRSTSTARARSSATCRRRARPAADGHRRLERRHEPGRRRRQGRERLARLVPPRGARRASRRSPRRAATLARAERWRAHCRGLAGTRSSATAGTATGIAAPTSTTARRSARPRTSECRIDSIAQSWAVLSRRGRARARATRAMAAAERELVRRDDGLALLFTPPFDRTPHDPGYIKGYPPGVRENGGQYTHAAIWIVIALRDAGRRRQGGGAASPCSTRSPTPRRQRTPSATRSSPTSSPPTSTRRRRTSGAAAGPGTRARPAGCIAPAWRASSGSAARPTSHRRSLHPAGVARLLAAAEARRRHIRDRGRESGRHRAVVVRLGRARRRALPSPHRVPLATGPGKHASGSCSVLQAKRRHSRRSRPEPFAWSATF